MSPTTENWLKIAFVAFTLASVYFGSLWARERRQEGMEFALKSFFICLWAATLYLTMILGETVTEINGELVFWGRYIDWVVTTPLLLLDLGVLAGLRPKLIAGIMGADVFMIVTGLVADLVSSPVNYLWYTISTGAFIALIISLFTEFTASAEIRRRQGEKRIFHLFTTLRNLLTITWSGYPIVWILGAEGFRLIDTGFETVLYALLDITAKIVFGYILTRHIGVLAKATETLDAAVQDYMDGADQR